jgi:hypothetical protein
VEKPNEGKYTKESSEMVNTDTKECLWEEREERRRLFHPWICNFKTELVNTYYAMMLYQLQWLFSVK